MKTNNLEQEITTLIANIIEMEPSQIDPNARLVEDIGMDSMMALEILAGIEKMYRIVISEEMLPKFTSLKETVRIVKEIKKKKV